MTETTYAQISSFALNLTSQYPREKVADRVKITDDRQWAQESFEIAKKYTYGGIEPGTTPSAEYIATGRRVVNEQLAVAGYRLADLMLTLKHGKFQSAVQDMLERSE